MPCVDTARGHFQGQPGLAAAARADQGQQPAVRVSSRQSGSNKRSAISASILSRPTNGVRPAGRLCAGGAGLYFARPLSGESSATEGAFEKTSADNLFYLALSQAKSADSQEHAAWAAPLTGQ